jgi:hypothetical protein
LSDMVNPSLAAAEAATPAADRRCYRGRRACRQHSSTA